MLSTLINLFKPHFAKFLLHQDGWSPCRRYTITAKNSFCNTVITSNC